MNTTALRFLAFTVLRCHFVGPKETWRKRGVPSVYEEPTPGLEPGTPSLRVKCGALAGGRGRWREMAGY